MDKKIQMNGSSVSGESGFAFGGLLVVMALVATLFYGVAGEDKSLLLDPLAVAGWLCLSAWMLWAAWSRKSAPSAPPGFLLMLLFAGYGIAVGMTSAIPYEAKMRMLVIGLVVGAYYVWSNSLELFRRSRTVLGWVMLFALLACFYGLVNHFKTPDQVLWAERYYVYTGRLASTYICPNHFAHLLQMLLPFCLVLILIPQSGIFLRILSGYCIVIYLPTIYFTESRAGMLGSLLALGITVCLLALRKSKKLFLVLLIVVPLLAALLLVGAWNYSEMFKRRMTPMVSFLAEAKTEGFANTTTRDFRPLTWLDSMDMVKAAPAIGFGPGSYRYVFETFRKKCKVVGMVTGHPHNEYLEVASEYGLIGFGLLALAWGYGLVRLFVFSLKTQNEHHAFMAMAFLGTAAGTLLHSFFDFQMHVFQNALIFALLAAIASGPLSAGRRRSRRSEVKGQAGRGAAALECGDGSPLSVRADSFNRERTQGAQRREENKTSNLERATPNFEPASGSRGAVPENLTSDTGSPASVKLWLSKGFSWLLAVGCLLAAAFCIQIMSSSFIRALGDQAAASARQAPDSALRARKFYTLAARIDPQNWRADKGMGMLISSQRYYTLDRIEKVRLAEEERDWFEKAYVNNSKDPEIISTLGKTLIFLGRQKELAANQALSTTNQAPSAGAEQIGQGLELLREACRFRPFNDGYWWSLGAELRKAGFYQEALETFQRMETMRRTPSSRKNIQWLEKQLAEGQESEVGGQKPDAVGTPRSDLYLKREKTDLNDLLKAMEK